MTWALRSFIFNHQLFPSPTVLARNVVRQQGRGNGGGPSVLSTPKGVTDKHFLKKLRARLFPALPSTPCCDGDSCLFQQVSGEACDANAVSRKDKMAPSITLCLLTCNSLTHRRSGVSRVAEVGSLSCTAKNSNKAFVLATKMLLSLKSLQKHDAFR